MISEVLSIPRALDGYNVASYNIEWKNGKNIMESPIDERYRLMLLEFYLQNAEEREAGKKWIFSCPLCSPFARTEAKRREKKGALLWNAVQNSWLFNCKKCTDSTTFFRFLEKINPEIARKYQRDRWHSGTTGRGHNCGAPKRVVGISTMK